MLMYKILEFMGEGLRYQDTCLLPKQSVRREKVTGVFIRDWLNTPVAEYRGVHMDAKQGLTGKLRP